MSALAWPIVALVLGGGLLAVLWRAVVVRGERVEEVAEAGRLAHARIRTLGEQLDSAQRGAEQDRERLVDLENWRQTLKNRNGGRD